MTGILMLDSLTRGNTLKQGDKTPLTYKLLDADGDNLNVAGKTATVRLVHPNYLTIGYEKTGLTVQSDDTVTFTIDKIIPARKYHVEIIVDDKFVFPSRSVESKFTIDKSSLGTESNIIEIVGKDVLIRAVKSQVDTELQPLVTSLQAAQQAETQRASAESTRVSAEAQREIDHANRSAELASKVDKVVLKNLVKNGDFENGSTGWITSPSSSVVNGELKNITNSLEWRQETPDWDTQHKYFYSMDIRKLSGVTPWIFSLGLRSNSVKYGGDLTGTRKLTGTVKSNGGMFRLGVYSNDEAVEVYYDNVLLIDLTETFGAGNEPTKEQMDRLIEITGYIDDEYALNNKEMLDYLMNDIRSKADKVVIKNLVANGDFSEGMENLRLSEGARIEDQKLIYAHGTSGSTIRWSGKRFNTDLYYFYIKYNTDETSDAYKLSNNQGNVFSLNSSSTFHSDRRTYPNATIISIYGGQTATNDLVVDYYILLNLTETFGAGNEPSKEEMDELIKVTGYIDGEYTLNNKEMLGHLMSGKANKKQADWIAPTLLNGFVGVVGNEPKYMKDELGFVHIKGRATGGTTHKEIFVLPVGYRPLIGFVVPVYRSDVTDFGRVDIGRFGSVFSFHTTTSPDHIDLTCIPSFKAEG